MLAWQLSSGPVLWPERRSGGEMSEENDTASTAERSWPIMYGAFNILHGALFGAVVSQIQWRRAAFSDVWPIVPLMVLISLFITYLSNYQYKTRGNWRSVFNRYSYFALVIGLSSPLSWLLLEQWWILPMVLGSWVFCTMSAKNLMDELH